VHTTGVGVLMPHVLAFNMAVDAVKAKKIAEALGVDTEGLSRGEIIEAAVAELYELYADIGLRPKFTADELPRDRIREMAERAVPGLYAGFSGATNAPENVTDRTIIVSRALRKMTVRQAEEIFEACAA